MNKGADLISLGRLLKGDIIVVGTNGLFDNVWDDEIVEIVNQTIENTKVDEETAAAYPLGRDPPTLHGS
jgi:serine/threonine protein phosphatase PrpC